MKDSPTVLVIGGGATGTGIARDLALRGIDVMLAERNGLSSGASSRSHGLLHSGARYAEADQIGAEECIEENQVLRAIAGECIRDTGGLFVQLSEDDPDYFESKRAACESIGIETRVLDGNEARRAVPGLSPRVERAMWVPDGVIYPSRLGAANAADAEAHGGAVYPHAPLERLMVEDGRVTQAVLGGSVGKTVAPQYVVNATGAWAGQVAAMAGVNVEMAPSRGVMISVKHDALGPALNRCRDPDDGDIIVPHEREVVLGTTSVSVSDPDTYEEADWEVEKSVQECAKMLPPVAEAAVVRTWWGVRPLYAPDEQKSNRRGISRGFFVLDHASDGVENFLSIVGGKLTTYRQMAEAVADRVCQKLGVDAECQTATQALPGANDPAHLDALVARYDAQGPTDADVVVNGSTLRR
ncbi:glycerol-3-phosphate dehydrogenase [Longimonas halophila]|uniref:Glycerol-3-phosphate dehydrogenase n=1 Tax=Longimonas halophila TaxID=1469170 RepID=A0A2H3NM93_9BACT|nr:FAD-dependent oxidoreductase [Longimonas halophila]PEN07730.1 glycerol-3-phosphate dehydrogenase [Longimonas halophila]